MRVREREKVRDYESKRERERKRMLCDDAFFTDGLIL